jgi:hypothetical protein
VTAATVRDGRVFTNQPANFGRFGHGVAEFSKIIAENAPNTQTEQWTRLLELELIQKRATWKQAGERYRAFQMFGFSFCFCSSLPVQSAPFSPSHALASNAQASPRRARNRPRLLDPDVAPFAATLSRKRQGHDQSLPERRRVRLFEH